MYRFIVFWTLIIVGMVHICSGLVAAVVFFRKHPFIAVSIPFVAAAVGLLLAFISGSIVGESVIHQVIPERPRHKLSRAGTAHARVSKSRT